MHAGTDRVRTNVDQGRVREYALPVVRLVRTNGWQVLPNGRKRCIAPTD